MSQLVETKLRKILRSTSPEAVKAQRIAATAPKNKPVPQRPLGKLKRPTGMPQEMLLKAFQAGGRSLKELSEHSGMDRSDVSAALYGMIQAGTVRRVERGVYELIGSE